MKLSNVILNQEDFNDFRPFESCEKRKYYDSLPEDYKELILKTGNKYLKSPIPQILATDYLEYTRNGNRINFESLYFERRRGLASLVLAECVEYNAKYFDKIINLIILICEESGWQLPAHNNYIRDTKPLAFPDVNRPVLDLFALDTAALLSTSIYILKEKLACEYNFIIERVSDEINKRIITPYLNYDFWWTGENNQPTLNWTVWCTQNVLLSTFFNDFSKDIKLEVTKKSLRSIDAFLNDYHEDGCCDEGAEYYRHAGLCLFGAIDILNEVTSNRFDFVFKDNKVRNIANYIKNVHVENNYFINFADCAAKAGYCGAREYLFAKAIEDKDLMDFALVQHSNIKEIDLPLDINLYYKMKSILTSVDMRKEVERAGGLPEKITYSDIYYEGVGLFIARDNDYCIGVKSGCNYDNHNHNDTGSFTLYKNGVPLVIDVGIGNYTAKTFSKDRYSIWTMQSSYHNLPEFDGVMEMDGREFKACDVVTVFEKDKASITMRLENAYPKNAKISEYKREIILNKNENIIIEDFAIGDYETATLNLMFWKKPKVDKNSLIIEDISVLDIWGSNKIEVEEVLITDSKLHGTWGDFVYRVRVGFNGKIKICVKNI